jgi:hypothetical protein
MLTFVVVHNRDERRFMEASLSTIDEIEYPICWHGALPKASSRYRCLDASFGPSCWSFRLSKSNALTVRLFSYGCSLVIESIVNPLIRSSKGWREMMHYFLPLHKITVKLLSRPENKTPLSITC